MLDRRRFLGLASLGALAVSLTEAKAFSLSDAEWRKRLNAEQYEVLRQGGTERPFTSPLLEEHRNGVFACAGCAQDLFSSATKFDSGTGWPSFCSNSVRHCPTSWYTSEGSSTSASIG